MSKKNRKKKYKNVKRNINDTSMLFFESIKMEEDKGLSGVEPIINFDNPTDEDEMGTSTSRINPNVVNVKVPTGGNESGTSTSKINPNIINVKAPANGEKPGLNKNNNNTGEVWAIDKNFKPLVGEYTNKAIQITNQLAMNNFNVENVSAAGMNKIKQSMEGIFRKSSELIKLSAPMAKSKQEVDTFKAFKVQIGSDYNIYKFIKEMTLDESNAKIAKAIDEEYKSIQWFSSTVNQIIGFFKKIIEFAKNIWNKIVAFFKGGGNEQQKNNSGKKQQKQQQVQQQQTQTKTQTTQTVQQKQSIMFLQHLGVLEAGLTNIPEIADTKKGYEDFDNAHYFKKVAYIIAFRLAMLGFWLAMIKYLGGKLSKSFVAEATIGNGFFGFIGNLIKKSLIEAQRVLQNPASGIFHIVCLVALLMNFYGLLRGFYYLYKVNKMTNSILSTD